ncbi:uncharacterized protein LOC116851214 [Odontomachus brunneus]|uniref:uncharacterized protein LOC116851214 n=1 Tax=Odontomachus brunneus TaxID=486640 RepID=UPI0013F18C87|nr:uncharacterized protein LOC116851214 [Odontomachus brunneus]
MYDISSDNKMVQCPYNKCHIMPSSSLQRHLVNCEKNYRENDKVICPYNATHRLNKLEIAEHIKICPTKKVVETCHIEQYSTLTSAKRTNESSFTSIFEDSEEEQMEAFSRFKASTYINQNDESESDDVESFVSSVGMGRGRLNRRDNVPIRLRFSKRGYNS